MAADIDEALFIEEEKVEALAGGQAFKVLTSLDTHLVRQVGEDAAGGAVHFFCQIRVDTDGLKHVGAVSHRRTGALGL